MFPRKAIVFLILLLLFAHVSGTGTANLATSVSSDRLMAGRPVTKVARKSEQHTSPHVLPPTLTATVNYEDPTKPVETITIPLSISSTLKEQLKSRNTLNSIKTVHVHVADGVNKIDAEAFNGCVYITTVELPTSVTSIGNEAFCGCMRLRRVHMPSVVTVGKWAFCECTSLENVEMPSVVKVSNLAFLNCTSLVFVNVECVKWVGEEAFCGCTMLNSISMPSVETVGVSAFHRCTSLRHVHMPSVETIYACAFCRCTRLGRVDMQSVKSVGRNAFSYCESIAFAHMPNATSLDSRAFNECKNLEDVHIENVETIGSSAFGNCVKARITLTPEAFRRNEVTLKPLLNQCNVEKKCCVCYIPFQYGYLCKTCKHVNVCAQCMELHVNTQEKRGIPQTCPICRGEYAPGPSCHVTSIYA